MEMVVIYGAITLHENYLGSVEFIKSLGKDPMFPAISTLDFGLGDYDDYHYEGKLTYDYTWDNMIISYSNSTGAAIFDERNLRLYILKMEHILRNIDFVQAIIHIQSVESSENANLFWEKKQHRYFDKPDELKNELLIETDEWNFGFGRRSLPGYLEEPTDKIRHSLEAHPYPVLFSREIRQVFYNHIKELMREYETKGIPRTAFEKETRLPAFELRNIINYLQFKKTVIIEIEEDLEVVRVIKPDLLKMDCLYR